jgi:NAD+ kinase
MRNKFLIAKSHKHNLTNQIAYVSKYFEELGFTYDFLPDQRPTFGATSTSELDDYDFCLVLGGDGTVLFAASSLRGTNIPIIGVNFGNIGFLTAIRQDDLSEACRKLSLGKWSVNQRNLVQVNLERTNQTEAIQDFALNEMTLFKNGVNHMIRVAVEIDAQLYGEFACDGVVIASATGSTAYNYANSGAIMWPDVEAFQLTVIAGQTNMPRPLIFSKNSSVSIRLSEKTKSDAVIIDDGLRTTPFKVGDRLNIKLDNQTISFVDLFDQNFSERLIYKLGNISSPK